MSKKQAKKPSQRDLDRASIRTLMGTEGRTPLVIAQIAGGNRRYVAVHNNGMVFYDYGRKYEHNFIKKSEKRWSEFTNVIVDHFAVKSVLTLVSENGRFDVIVIEKGKEVEQAIKSYSDASVESIERAFWNKILGFRSQTKWKMITAGIGYAFMFLVVVAIASGDKKEPTSTPPTETLATATASQPVVLTPEQKAKQEGEAKAKQEAEAKVAAEKKTSDVAKGASTLNMSPVQFKDAFNKAAVEFESPFRITDLQVKEGAVQDTFQVMFNNRVGITAGVVKQSGLVRDVMMIGQGDGSLKSGAEIVATMGMIIAATNPDLPIPERGALLTEMGITEKGKEEGSAIRNNIKYGFTRSDVIGTMFYAQNANE